MILELMGRDGWIYGSLKLTQGIHESCPPRGMGSSGALEVCFLCSLHKDTGLQTVQ